MDVALLAKAVGAAAKAKNLGSDDQDFDVLSLDQGERKTGAKHLLLPIIVDNHGVGCKTRTSRRERI